MSGWFAALRIARREAWRAKRRSALVVALIGLPVLALSFAAVTYDSFRLTDAQELDRRIGAADAMVTWEHDGPVDQSPEGFGWPVGAGIDHRPPKATTADLLEMLPPGSRAVPLRRGHFDLRTNSGVGPMETEEADLSDPIHNGRLELRDGRAPAAPGEVALTRAAGRRLGAGIGDRVSTADGSASWAVVGIVEYLTEQRVEALVFAPTAASASLPRTWLVEIPAPVTWDQVLALNRHGIVVDSRAVVLNPPPPHQVAPDFRPVPGLAVSGETLAIGGLVSGLALLEVVLLAGPAFAVGVRRRQRELALVAANGGAPAHQRRIVLADGLVLGLAGAIAGIGLGAGAAVAAIPLMEDHFYHARAGGVRLWPEALAALAGLSIVVGLLAALVPAAIAARQDVVAVLAGRRGIVRSRRRWLVLGLALTTVGMAVAGAGAWRTDGRTILGGLVATELGLVLCTPSLVGLVARVGRILPLAPRIALRDTARNRAAAAPAISAVMAAVAGSVALGMYIIGDQARWESFSQPGMPTGYAHVRYEVWGGGNWPAQLDSDQQGAVRGIMGHLLPADRVIDVPGAFCGPDAEPGTSCTLVVPTPPQNRCPYWETYAWRALTGAEQRAALADPRCQEELGSSNPYLDVVVDDGTLVPVLTGASGDDLAAAEAVLRAGGVVVSDEQLLVDGKATIEVWNEPDAMVPGRLLTAPGHVLATGVWSPYTVFVSPELVAAAGMRVEPVAALAVTSRMPSQAEQDALAAALQAIEPSLGLVVEREYEVEDPTLILLTIAAAVITLGAAGIATGLAAADRRTDLSTLGAVGASPRVRRMLSLSQSGVIAGLGAVLGSLAGIAAALTIMLAMNRDMAGEWPVQPPFPLLVPWPTLAVVLIAVPAVAMIGAGLLTRSRIPIERRLT